MNLRHPRAAVFGIWGLIGLFLVMQAAIWMAAGGFPRRPAARGPGTRARLGAVRSGKVVPCDRVGLALLSEQGGEFQTYTARVDRIERRSRPRPEIVFTTDRTALGTAVRSRAPLIIADTSVAAAEFLDLNVLHTSGFASALIVPLVARGRTVGTLNAGARQGGGV